ncbi:MAG: BamA/TamA family outer membrane protein [Actinobacteria bacterium]|nr:BamA/TamA family outer membrane protein [Actinomycetota bacterium]
MTDAVVEQPPQPPAEVRPAEVRPLPDFMRNKRRMNAADIADKKDDGYFTGLPLINSDPDTGVGFGARVLYFNNGSRDDVLFEATPYRHRAYAQAFFTTNGYQYHTLDYDAPYLGSSPFRLRASLVYEKNIAANYFGLGERSLGRLSFPGSGERYASQSAYTDALRRVQPDSTAFTRENQYILERPKATATLERDFFGGVVRGFVGLSVAYASVRQWTGESIKADDPATGRTDLDAREAPTRLDRDCAAGLVVGCGGGFDNTLKLGVAYDTRDFEPDPNSGVFVELSGELSGKYTLSEYDWARLTFSPRAYYSPFPKLTDLVIAGRFVGSVQSEGTPFFELNQLTFADYNRAGLGGLRTIRGFKQDRFVGRVVALANLELRWTFYEFDVNLGKRQHFGLMLAPFLDVGRVFDSLSISSSDAFVTARALDFASRGTRRRSSSSTTASAARARRST